MRVKLRKNFRQLLQYKQQVIKDKKKELKNKGNKIKEILEGLKEYKLNK